MQGRGPGPCETDPTASVAAIEGRSRGHDATAVEPFRRAVEQPSERAVVAVVRAVMRGDAAVTRR
jgi:hypothetical protein